LLLGVKTQRVARIRRGARKIIEGQRRGPEGDEDVVGAASIAVGQVDAQREVHPAEQREFNDSQIASLSAENRISEPPTMATPNLSFERTISVVQTAAFGKRERPERVDSGRSPSRPPLKVPAARSGPGASGRIAADAQAKEIAPE
jgi:hypothetical protein